MKQIIDWSSKRIWATLTEEELYNTQNAFNLIAKPGVSLEFLLGVINSKLMTYYHRKKFLDEFKMRFQKVLIKDARRFPIRLIKPTNKAAKSGHDRIVQLVGKMLTLQERLWSLKTPHEKIALERQIDAIDSQIDHEVYCLYGLTATDIAIVEGAPMIGGDIERLTEDDASAEPDWARRDTESHCFSDGNHRHMILREDSVDYKVGR